MANFLKGFLDNVVSRALNPKGTLADYAHGARLYVDDSSGYASIVKISPSRSWILIEKRRSINSLN